METIIAIIAVIQLVHLCLSINYWNKKPIRKTPIEYEWEPTHRDASLMAVIQQSNDNSRDIEKILIRLEGLAERFNRKEKGHTVEFLATGADRWKDWEFAKLLSKERNKTIIESAKTINDYVATMLSRKQTNQPESRFKTVDDVTKWAEEWIDSDVIKEGHKWREGFRQCAVAMFNEIQRELATDIPDHKKGKKGRENENK